MPGTRVLLSFRGHGSSDALVDGWDYDELAADLRAVADEVAATRCVGLSLGGGALLRLLRDEPDRFDRLAFVLPAAIDATRADGATVRLQALGAAIDGGDAEAVAQILLAEVPAEFRDRRGVAMLLTRRAQALVQRPAPTPRSADRPLADRAVLSAVTAPALVVGQQGDPLHPLALAVELAAALPRGELLGLPAGGVFWTGAGEVQQALAGHVALEPDSDQGGRP